MAIVTNFDELKRLHQEAMAGGVKSRAWIDFAITMMDSFPRIYDRAKAVNACLITAASRDVMLERQRQINGEGWTSEHDDQHADDALALAAAWYALPDGVRHTLDVNGMNLWPASWDYRWFKTGYRRRDLVKAGALIVAEIERLDRAETSGA